jgi:hypothetical protein
MHLRPFRAGGDPPPFKPPTVPYKPPANHRPGRKPKPTDAHLTAEAHRTKFRLICTIAQTSGSLPRSGRSSAHRHHRPGRGASPDGTPLSAPEPAWRNQAPASDRHPRHGRPVPPLRLRRGAGRGRAAVPVRRIRPSLCEFASERVMDIGLCASSAWPSSSAASCSNSSAISSSASRNRTSLPAAAISRNPKALSRNSCRVRIAIHATMPCIQPLSTTNLSKG